MMPQTLKETTLDPRRRTDCASRSTTPPDRPGAQRADGQGPERPLPLHHGARCDGTGRRRLIPSLLRAVASGPPPSSRSPASPQRDDAATTGASSPVSRSSVEKRQRPGPSGSTRWTRRRGTARPAWGRRPSGSIRPGSSSVTTPRSVKRSGPKRATSSTGAALAQLGGDAGVKGSTGVAGEVLEDGPDAVGGGLDVDLGAPSSQPVWGVFMAARYASPVRTGPGVAPVRPRSSYRNFAQDTQPRSSGGAARPPSGKARRSLPRPRGRIEDAQRLLPREVPSRGEATAPGRAIS